MFNVKCYTSILMTLQKLGSNLYLTITISNIFFYMTKMINLHIIYIIYFFSENVLNDKMFNSQSSTHRNVITDFVGIQHHVF